MHRRLCAGALAAACLLILSACGAQFDGAPAGSQRDVIGDVVITTKLCSNDGQGCGAVGTTDPVQSLLAYRVPEGAKAPALTAGSGLAFHRDAELAAFLEQSDHQDGFVWYGFVSDAITPASADQRLADTVDADFALPPGAPYRGPFAYKVVTGSRHLGSADQASWPTSCGGEEERPSLRAAAPSAAASCDEDDATGSIETRDLALSGQATARAHLRAAVQQGAAGDLPFTATFAGKTAPDADFALTASAPGLGAATVSPDHLVPATDSATPLTVHVEVPAGAAPGDYPITLTARLANGQARTATGTLTVTAAPAPSSTPPAGAPVQTAVVQGVTFTAPSTRQCLSRRLFEIMLLRHGRDLVDGDVTVNGHPVAVYRGAKHMTAQIDLRGLSGVIAVRIRARTAGGGRVDFTRRYRTCSHTPGDNGLSRKGAI